MRAEDHAATTRRRSKPGSAIEALGDGKTVAEIAYRHDVHPNQMAERRQQLMERAAGAFVASRACVLRRQGSDGRRPNAVRQSSYFRLPTVALPQPAAGVR